MHLKYLSMTTLLPALLFLAGCQTQNPLGSPVIPPERPKPIGRAFTDGLEHDVYRQQDVAWYGRQLEAALDRCNSNFK